MKNKMFVQLYLNKLLNSRFSNYRKFSFVNQIYNKSRFICHERKVYYNETKTFNY